MGFINYNYDDDTNGADNKDFAIGKGEGVRCKNCYAHFGAEFDFELEFDGFSLKHFKVR